MKKDILLPFQSVIKNLTPREIKVVKMRQGLDDRLQPNGIKLTLSEIAQEFGVTRERIRQIETKAMNKIKEDADKLLIQLKTKK